MPSLVIVFSLFGGESHCFMKLGGIHLRTFSHGKDKEARKITVNYGYGCSEIKTTKKWNGGGGGRILS